MEYNTNKIITDDGKNLVAQSLQEGKKVNFDSFIVTDTQLPNDRQLSAMTVDNFKNIRKYPITNLKKGKNSVQPEARFDNNDLSEDYSIVAIGLLANISESNTVLFGITQNAEGTPAMLPKQSSTPYLTTYDMGITVNNPDNYQATITPAGYVDQTTFDKTINEIHTNIQDIDLSGAIKSATQYTDDQLKGYTNTSDLNEKLNGKQPLGSYVTTDEFNKYGLSISDDKLMYGNKPLLTEQVPNPPKLKLSLNNDLTIHYIILPSMVSGGTSITSYNLYYKKENENNFTQKVIDINDAEGDLKLEFSNYSFKVSAKNYVGTSEDSEEYNLDITLDGTVNITADDSIIKSGSFTEYKVNLKNVKKLFNVDSIRVHGLQSERNDIQLESIKNNLNVQHGDSNANDSAILRWLNVIPIDDGQIILQTGGTWNDNQYYIYIFAEALNKDGNSTNLFTKLYRFNVRD